MAYVNNVLYYIDHNIKGSSENKVIEVCKLLFQEKEIIEAKQYLLETCQPVLARINKSLSEDVKKERRNSDDRSKVDVSIKDIIKILECFMGNDQKLEIMAKNPESVPKVKPESVSMVSIVTKLQEVDVTLSKIVKENTKIKCECDCVEVKKENVILKNKIMEIEKIVQNMNNFLSNNQLGHVLPDALPSNVPSVNANLTQLEKGIVDSNTNTDVLPNPDISVNGNENTNVSNLESNVSLNDLPNKETRRETDIEVITQNLATLDITSDKDASSTLPAPVSETGAKSDTEGTDTTVVQEENVHNNAQ